MSGSIFRYTLDSMILLLGLYNLHNLKCCSCIVVIGCFLIRLSTNGSLYKNIHVRPLYLQEANKMFEGWTKLPIAIIYICVADFRLYQLI